MKEFLLILIFGSFSNYGFSQAPNILEEDLAQSGDIIAGAFDNFTAVEPGPSGSGITWDFSHLNAEIRDTIEYISPAGTPNASKYPDATMALENPFDNSYYYFMVNNTGEYNLNGQSSYSFSGLSPGEEAYHFDGQITPAQKIMHVPTTINTYWTGSYSWMDTKRGTGIYFDSIRVYQIIEDSVVADSWGTVITPEGSYPNTLRLTYYSKNQTIDYEYNDDEWVEKSNEISWDTTYMWWTKGQPYPVMEVRLLYATATPDGSETTYMGAWYHKLDITGILFYKNAYAKTSAYPNPARDAFFIPSAHEVISLKDMTGRIVDCEITSVNEQTVKVNLPEGASGIYFAVVKYNGEKRIERVSVLK